MGAQIAPGTFLASGGVACSNLWPAAVGAPFAIRIAQLRIAAWHDVPQYPRTRNVGTTIELGDGENYGDYVRMKFITEDAPAEVIEFYESELSRRGWKPGPPHFIEWRMYGTTLWFARSVPLSGFGNFLLGMQGSLHIKFGPTSNHGEVQCEIIYGFHWDYGKTRSISSDMWRRPYETLAKPTLLADANRPANLTDELEREKIDIKTAQCVRPLNSRLSIYAEVRIERVTKKCVL